MSRKSAYVASVEDAEEDSGSSLEGIEGTRRYAFSEAPTNYKERPNTGKSRADKRPPPRHEVSDPESLSDSDSTARHSSGRVREARKELERQERDRDRRKKERKQREREREREAAAELAQRKRVEAKAAKEREAQKPVKKTRPTSLTQSKTLPIVQQYRRGRVEDPSCYGVQQPAVSGGRPRGQSQSTYYGQQVPTPPIAHAGWHQAYQNPSPFGSMGSFPPSPFAAGAPSVIGASPTHTPGYFDNQMTAQQQHAHLRTRFERPSSAMGYRAPAPSSYGYESYEEEVTDPRVSIVRRPSRTKKQNDEDKKRMPPPDYIPRPKSAIPPTSSAPFRPPPAQHQTPIHKSRVSTTRSRVGFADQRGFADEDFIGHAELFADASPEPTHDRRTALARTRRGSVTYEHHGMDIMQPGRRSRRSSIYADRDRALGTGGVSLEDDKYLDAMKYQDDVNGGPSVPLTAETLRKANTRGGGSSRSTRSSGSRDDSDYKRSNTTGITRSSSGDTDNVTIKVSGSAVVRVQGAEIECQDGGEITFSSRAANSRYSSDRASTVYQLEDSRSRVERKALPHRPRAPSQADSHSRGGYLPSHAPYDPNFSAESYI